MNLRQPPPRPTSRRAVVIAALLSVLPGLGHAYAFRLPRALIWFGGTIAVGLVLQNGSDDAAVQTIMPVVLAVAAAADIALVMWLDRLGPKPL